MQTMVVVLDLWPPADVTAAAAALITCRGGTATDHARQLRSCRGIVAERLPAAAAQAMAEALTAAGTKAWAAPEELVPTLPRPLTSRRLDPRDAETLEASVRMTGPPERIPHKRILALVPAVWMEATTASGAPAEKGPGVVGVAKSVALTGGIGLLFKGKGKQPPGAAKVTESAVAMVAIVAVGGVRIHGFAHRMDYSVMGKAAAKGDENWPTLVRALRRRARAGVVGGELIDTWLSSGELPDWLYVGDNNDLGRSIRWLMLRAALRRLAARQ